MNVKKFIILTALMNTFIIFAQTGAAGVGNSTNNVVWLDANSLALTNGSQVSTFTDLSGNSNNFSQSTATKRPIFSTATVNGLPALDFDGVDDALATGSIAAMVSANVTYFIVYQRATNVQQFLLGANYTGEPKKWQTYCNNGSNSLISAQYSPAINHVSYTDPGTFSFLSTHITPTKLTTYKQGTLMMTKTATYTVPASHNNLTLGNIQYPAASNGTLNGYIAEVIIYNSALNALERTLVENYLGAKYNMSIPTDLYDYQATHSIGLIGIGNNSINSQTSAQGSGVLSISAPSALSSNEYLLLAHTNTDLLSYSGNVPVSLPTHQRWSRVWRADEVGEVGNVTVKFDLSGGLSFGSGSSYRLLIDSDGDFTDATIVAGSYDAGTQTLTFNANINAGDYITLCGENQTLNIHSVADGLWSNPNTWDCICIPTLNDNVFIEASHEVTVDIDAETKLLSIDPAGTLTMTSPVTLDLYGEFDQYGTVNFTDGRVAFVGLMEQYIDAGGGTVAFNDLEINNTSGFDVSFYDGTYSLNGTLYPNGGSMNLDATPGNTFTFVSNSSSGGGRIDEVSGGFTFTGDYIVERFIPAGNADYRNLASPVTNGSISQWDEDLFISGLGFPDGCATDGNGCFYSCRFYTNSVSYNVTSPTYALVNGKGYEIFVGDDLSIYSGGTIYVKGQLESSNAVTLSLNTGWHTVGNPFVSPILYSQTTRTSQISNYFYVYDASIGDYQYYDGADGLGSIPELDNGLMTTGQGIWVFATSIGTLTFEQADKTSLDATFIKSSTDLKTSSAEITLKENATTYQSTISFGLSKMATDGADSTLDFMHLSMGYEAAPSFSISIGNTELKRNLIADNSQNKSFKLNMSIKRGGYYTISASDLTAFENYRQILLYDHLTGEMVDLKLNSDYIFFSEIYQGQRFTLILSNEALSQGVNPATLNSSAVATLNNWTVSQMGHTFDVQVEQVPEEQVQISLVNMLGQNEVYSNYLQFQNGSNVFTLPADLHGVHLLVIRIGDSVITKKIVL